MVVFADTSALIKLFLNEPDSAAVIELAATSAVCVCRIAWAEAMATFSRRAREQPSDTGLIDNAKRTFTRHWPRLSIIDVSQSVVERAGDYADTFALRGYDAVQLAAAQELAIALPAATTFACFDARLNKAARALGMVVPFAEAR